MDAYARSNVKTKSSGAAYMMIHNHSEKPDRLLKVHSKTAKKVELHTHFEDQNGVMKMLHLAEGLKIAGNGMLHLKRGKNHIMFMGLENVWKHGDVIDVNLIFQRAGEINLKIPIDLKRNDGNHTH